MLHAARILSEQRSVAFRLIRAPTIPRVELESLVAAAGVAVEIVEADRFGAIADSHLALCASGTATLEVGLLGTPMVVAYRLSPWSYWLGRALVRLPHYTLVNLVLEDRVVPELIQGAASGESLAREVCAILDSPARIDQQRQGLARLRERLGPPGASGRVAAVLDEVLGQ
jgi:lipid-A-disaccharide synthase